MRAIYFSALRMSAAIAFCGPRDFEACGKRQGTSDSYVLIGQNLTGEFTRKIYAASGNLLTDSWS